MIRHVVAIKNWLCHIRGRHRRHSWDAEKGVEIFEALVGGVVESGEVEEGGEAGSARGEEEVAGDVEVGGDREPHSAEEVQDKSTDGEVGGDGEEGLAHVGVVKAEDLKG